MNRDSPFADGPGPAAVYFAYRAGAWLAEHTPPRIADRLARSAGDLAYRRAQGKRQVVTANLARVVGEGPHLEQVVREAFRSYAEYWLETFRLGRYSHDELLEMVEPAGDSVALVEKVLGDGRGGLVITPHMGFYDLGVAWVGAKGWGFTTVAEVLRPRALFSWFARIRERHGLTVLPARNGKWVRQKLAEVMDSGGIVALVSDRDLGRRGIWVDFFGEPTTFPVSPAMLLAQKRVPLIAASIIKRGDKFVIRLEEVPYRVSGDEQADVRALAQVTAGALEDLIREAPEQWHLFSTNWPADEPDLPPRGGSKNHAGGAPSSSSGTGEPATADQRPGEKGEPGPKGAE